MKHEQKISCPNCKTLIEFDPGALLQGAQFTCQGCGAQIGIQTQSIPVARKAMEKFERLKKSVGKKK